MSMRYPGGLLTAATPVNAQYPSGVWTQAQTIPYVQQNVWQRDVYWPYTTLLLHGDGTNGAQNNTFLDSSTNNFTITRNGNTTQGSFTPFQQDGYWSNYFDGTGDYLSVPDNANLKLTADFTFECWVYPQNTGNTQTLFRQESSSYSPIVFILDSSYKPYIYVSSDASSWGLTLAASSSCVAEFWNHVAFTRSGNIWYIFLNGTQVATTTQSITPYNSSAVNVIGQVNSSFNYKGYISNLRIIKGTAIYTSNFTPPTAPLTAISGTSLLTCQSNRFIDDSANAFAITVNGNTAVQAFQPFPGFTTWSASVLGGSGYFDGSGDFLSWPTTVASTNFGTGSYTIEFWVYAPLNNDKFFLDLRGPLNNMHITTGGVSSTAGVLRAVVGGNTILSSNVVTDNTWHHCAIVRNGSSAVTLYVDGVAVGSGTDSTNYAGANSTGYVSKNSVGTNELTGYLSNIRIVKAAVYTSAFTPPTAPFTAISNTQFLLNFTNAGIFDNAQMNDLETVGNAQVSTSVVKYGTGSMAFDGNGDVLIGNPSQFGNYINGSGDWTYEFWVYYIALPTGGTYGASIYAQDDGAGVVSPFNIVQQGNTWKLWGSTNGSAWDIFDNVTLASTSLSTATWYHIAFVRNSGTLKMYVNGVQAASTTLTASIQVNTSRKLWLFGSWQNNPSNAGGINGYIDDLRITKGVARYITNFTPPIARMPNQ